MTEPKRAMLFKYLWCKFCCVTLLLFPYQIKSYKWILDECPVNRYDRDEIYSHQSGATGHRRSTSPRTTPGHQPIRAVLKHQPVSLSLWLVSSSLCGCRDWWRMVRGSVKMALRFHFLICPWRVGGCGYFYILLKFWYMIKLDIIKPRARQSNKICDLPNEGQIQVVLPGSK